MKAIIILVFLSLLIIGCSTTGDVVEKNLFEVDDSFKEVCKENRHDFMFMEPTVDGIPTGGPLCGGCMIGGTHFCSEAEYLEAVKSG